MLLCTMSNFINIIKKTMAKKKEKVVVEDEVVAEVTTEVVTTEVVTADDGGFSKRHPNATEGVIYE